MNRSVELQANLSTAMEHVVSEAFGQGSRVDMESLLTASMMNLVVAMDADTALELQSYALDTEKGILALRANGDYMHPNGLDGDTSWERVVLYEKEVAESKLSCEVNFYLSKEDLVSGRRCYKSYSILEGESMIIPVEPQHAQKRFAVWKDVNDYVADFSLPVESDICYYATWE